LYESKIEFSSFSVASASAVYLVGVGEEKKVYSERALQDLFGLKT
jgi:hypothetical protein